ncbi:MAG: TIGR03936 family radical SAM-associated protein [bacterium]
MDTLLVEGGYRPRDEFSSPARLSSTLLKEILPLVSRPARYIGGEVGAVRKEWETDRANILLAFPDAYEIGMSYAGLRILYQILNQHEQTYADFAFAPWPDLEARLREGGLPLFGLQSRRSAGQFDVLGFSLCYELAYTNLLTMLDLAGIPLLVEQRGEGAPLVIAGGACVLNPTIAARFCDLVFLGDGELTVPEIATAVYRWKQSGGSRVELLDQLAAIEGAWRPGRGAVRSRVLPDLNDSPLPAGPVAVLEPVHDRLTLEVMRGCTRGCRFCQAGMVTRPVRERNVTPLLEAASEGIETSGWDELSLLSLSTSDYSGLSSLVAGCRERLAERRTNLVLPSLRVNSLTPELYRQVSREAPSSFTFAPEAGSQRLRDVINKQITEADVLTGVREAFAAGAKKIKLYFMIGLPSETDADLDALVALVDQVVRQAPRGGGQVTVSISPFAPKPHTPFQWAGQIPTAEMARRNQYLAERLGRLRVKVSLRDPEVSTLEALLGLGDERLAEVVLHAWRAGARFDGWTERFDAGTWHAALDAAGLDPRYYLDARDSALPLPWDQVQAGVDRDFLVKEWERAGSGDTLSDCRLAGECYDCAACDENLDHRFAESPAQEPDSGSDHAAVLSLLTDRSATPAFDPRNVSPEDPEQERRRWVVWRQQAASKCWYRAEFSKSGEMRFLGHLDFQRLLQLALRRSGLPVAYSRGFHPHPLLKFGPPLPVGISGERELFDIAFAGETPGWEELCNAALPAGLQIRRSVVVGASVPRSIDQDATRFEYEVTLPATGNNDLTSATLTARVERFLASDSWPHIRHRPKGDVEIDARALVPTGGLAVEPAAADIKAGKKSGSTAPDQNPGGLRLRLSLLRTAGESSLSIHDFLTALCGSALPEPQLCQIRRTGYFGVSRSGHYRTPLEEVGDNNRLFWLRKRIEA